MTTNDEQYVPDEAHMEVAWIEYDDSATDINEAAAEFDRFLARVKRDAAREAVIQLRDHLARARGYDLIGPKGLDYYINTHHPEEA